MKQIKLNFQIEIYYYIILINKIFIQGILITHGGMALHVYKYVKKFIKI